MARSARSSAKYAVPALPVATFPAMIAAAILKSIGELCGYIGGAPTYAEYQMLQYEMHKLRYLVRSKA